MIRARNERFDQTDVSDLLGDMTPMEFLLRFTISHPDMHTTIVGTRNPDHLADNVAAASARPSPGRHLCGRQGPLPALTYSLTRNWSRKSSRTLASRTPSGPGGRAPGPQAGCASLAS